MMCWMSPVCLSLRYIFLMNLCWELGHLHLIWTQQRFAHPDLKTFPWHRLPPLCRQSSCLHHYSHGYRKLFLVSNFSLPACSLTSCLLILSTVGVGNIYSFRFARIYVFSWLDSLHSCNVSSWIMSSRPLTSLISSHWWLCSCCLPFWCHWSCKYSC